ncbi:UMP kinase [[Mycoplasma] testudinis]|uniref:UMP kinase n=1 Tax=[Mycoplasma] testudinis TaxID=33924 RepID=UPI000483E744|nr:UMP kinase [[Mycoplasma] testudinis]
MATLKNKKPRILIKISGGSLQATDSTNPFNLPRVLEICEQIKTLSKKYEIGIVVGGGNIWRGRIANDIKMDQRRADYVGMVATIINASLLEAQLDAIGVKACVLSAIDCPHLTRIITVDNIDESFNAGNIVIFAGGIGSPYFTTDTGAALRAIEIGAKTILVGKEGVDGVYSSDPNKDKKAKFYDTLTYEKAITDELTIMDLTSFTMCRENDIKLIIFNIDAPQALVKALDGKIKRTIVTK